MAVVLPVVLPAVPRVAAAGRASSSAASARALVVSAPSSEPCGVVGWEGGATPQNERQAGRQAGRAGRQAGRRGQGVHSAHLHDEDGEGEGVPVRGAGQREGPQVEERAAVPVHRLQHI